VILGFWIAETQMKYGNGLAMEVLALQMSFMGSVFSSLIASGNDKTEVALIACLMKDFQVTYFFLAVC
jgi:hypothetical protein